MTYYTGAQTGKNLILPWIDQEPPCVGQLVFYGLLSSHFYILDDHAQERQTLTCSERGCWGWSWEAWIISSRVLFKVSKLSSLSSSSLPGLSLLSEVGSGSEGWDNTFIASDQALHWLCINILLNEYIPVIQPGNFLQYKAKS